MGVGLEIIELRNPDEIVKSDPHAIVLPGGESTTMRHTGGIDGNGLLPSLFSWLRVNRDRPVLATCAGAILMADPQDGGPPLVNGEINRNGYGGQAESFQVELRTTELDGTFPGVFIRAPRFNSVKGDAVAVAFNQDEVVAIREGCWITGECHWHCDYCPLSENRREIDHMYANERRCEIGDWDAVIEEGKAMNASGTGITGGDPMMVRERVEDACKILKINFGDEHHIHLYTSIPFPPQYAESLASSGLDEIRFHLLDLNQEPLSTLLEFL